MTSMEKKEKTEKQLEFISQRLASKFEIVEINGEQYFHTNDVYFKPFSISDWEAIGIEYAHGLQNALLYRFADGDLFYLDEMTGEELLEAVLREIEG